MSPSVFITGCPCHLMHLAAGKAADKLEVDIGHLLIDIYYYLEKSSKRKQALKLLQDQFDLKDYKVIKHVCTRWLSLGKYVSRLLELRDALQAVFQTESESAKRKRGGKAKKSNTKAESVIASQKRTRDESIDRHTNNKEIGLALRKKFKSMEFLFERPLSIQIEGLQAQTMTVKDDRKYHQPSSSLKYKSVKKQTGSSHTYKGKTSKVDTKMAQKENKSVHCFEDSQCEMGYKKLNDPATKLYCLFMKSANPLFDAANVVLQKEEPFIHIMHKILSNQLSNLLIRFIKPEIIASAKLLTDIDFHDHANQKDNEDIAIGAEAREFIEHNSTLPVKMLYDNVREYYATACDYMLHKFPYGDELLLSASVADVNERQSKSFKRVIFFVKRYPFLLPPLSNLDHLEEEFLKYQVGIPPDNILNADRVDGQWHLISQLKDYHWKK